MNHRNRVVVVILCLLAAIACVTGLWARSHVRKANLTVNSLSGQIAELDSHLLNTNIDLESLFGEIVGNLEHDYIPLDRSARLPLRRGQLICERIASAAQSPVRRASAYCTLGHIHHHLHDLRDAIGAYRSAINSVGGATDHQAVHIRAYATNHLVPSLATLGYEMEALHLCHGLRQELSAAVRLRVSDAGPLCDELCYLLRNQAILLASNGSMPDAVATARQQLKLLQELQTSRAQNSTCTEQIVDAKLLLTGLLWTQPTSRGEALALLRETEAAMSASWANVRQKMERGEPSADYARYKAMAQALKRELAAAEKSLLRAAPPQNPSFWTQKRLFRGRRSVDTNLLLAEVRMPAEFETQQAIVLKWSGREWQDSFIVSLVREMVESVEVHLLVDDFEASEEAARELASNGVAQDNIRFHQVAANTIWLRDYGPLSILEGERSIWIDYQHLRPDDLISNDLATKRLGQLTGHRVIRAPLRLEGGNLLTNGQGLFVCTKQMMDDNTALGFTETHIRRRMKNLLGCSNLVILEPLSEEGTGHVDWFLTFVSPNTAVVGEYTASEDPENAAILNRNAAVLQQIATPAGPIRVVRIQMPPRLKDSFGGSYTNVVYANGTMIIPAWEYAGDGANQRARQLYQRLLPEWNVVSLDCSPTLTSAGAARCATVNIPR